MFSGVGEKCHCAAQLRGRDICFGGGPGEQELSLFRSASSTHPGDPELKDKMMKVMVMKMRTMYALEKSSYVMATTLRTDILHQTI